MAPAPGRLNKGLIIGDRKRLQSEEKPKADSRPLHTKNGKSEGIMVSRHRFIAVFAAESAGFGNSTKNKVRYSTSAANTNFRNLGN